MRRCLPMDSLSALGMLGSALLSSDYMIMLDMKLLFSVNLFSYFL